MKKKIAILGSTGSIGKTLLKLIEKDKKKFDVILLTANSNYKTLLNQAKKFKVKNLIVSNLTNFKILKNKTSRSKYKIFNNFDQLDRIFKSKIDYSMCAITGVDGLEPTFNLIKHTRKIAIANKEAIICGWNLINAELKKNNTEFIPVDSEHFSIWYSIKNNHDKIDNLFLTASGGPFINLPLKSFKKINLTQALKHPNWKMGKKITIDSATMMNKVFEVIEAKNIFNVNYDKISIITHPKSYIHSITKFKNGLIKLVAHDTNMKIPIYNTIYSNTDSYKLITKKIDFNKLNNLEFNPVNFKKFPLVNILKFLPSNNSLFETVIVSANDELVQAFLHKKIKFNEISKKLIKFISKSEFKKYKSYQPKKIQEILKLNKYVRFKINLKSI